MDSILLLDHKFTLQLLISLSSFIVKPFSLAYQHELMDNYKQVLTSNLMYVIIIQNSAEQYSHNQEGNDITSCRST